VPSIRNSTRAGDPLGVAVQRTDEPLRTAPLAMLVEIVFEAIVGVAAQASGE